MVKNDSSQFLAETAGHVVAVDVERHPLHHVHVPLVVAQTANGEFQFVRPALGRVETLVELHLGGHGTRFWYCPTGAGSLSWNTFSGVRGRTSSPLTTSFRFGRTMIRRM